MDVMDWLKLSCIVLLLAKMVYDVVGGPPRMMAWAMFTQALFCRVDAWSEREGGDRHRFNQWVYLGNQDPIMDIYRLDLLLAFAEDSRGETPTGAVTQVSDGDVRELRVVDGVLDG